MTCCARLARSRAGRVRLRVEVTAAEIIEFPVGAAEGDAPLVFLQELAVLRVRQVPGFGADAGPATAGLRRSTI